MTIIMRVRFKDDRPEEVHAIAAFRDSKQGCRALAADGRDLGRFGAEQCQSILVEIRFDDSADNPASAH